MINEVTSKEIKEALFGIRDNKALGPNGYSALFFKKAWSVVGGDFYKAIKEFFNTGKMLKELNSTVISLIPKSQSPLKVTDYRPIACCNVVYKCISKVITGRIKKSWKGGPRRVAFKIDIQKAYDTADPCFLENILNQFGFHKKMVQWIMNCVKTASFTINVNGENCGLFKGDDLLVLCNGDVSSVKVVKDSLDEFGKCSGLLPNFSKRKLPMKYLGVPLITKRLGIKDCRCLVDKVRNRISNWKNKCLSYAGRLQLVASILKSIQVYWCTVFLLPKNILKEIDNLLSGFLWCNGKLSKGKAKIAWKKVCKPKTQGGLGLKDLKVWNKALLIKHIWNIACKKDSLWVKWINTVKLNGRGIQRNMLVADMISDGNWNWPTEGYNGYSLPEEDSSRHAARKRYDEFVPKGYWHGNGKGELIVKLQNLHLSRVGMAGGLRNAC
nr:hypothetical protein [Tanacetum cinerariifolium]